MSGIEGTAGVGESAAAIHTPDDHLSRNASDENEHHTSISGASTSNMMSKPVNGHGRFKYDNGSEYDGEWKGGEMHGRGKMVFADGKTYEGDWIKDKMHGRGNMVWADGSTYEGDFSEGYIQGRGKRVFAKAANSIYEGDWSKDKKHGRGVQTFPADGKTSLPGLDFSWNAGDKIDGGFKDNVRHGACTYTFFNGETFNCTWVDGRCPEFTARQSAVQAASAQAEAAKQRADFEKNTFQMLFCSNSLLADVAVLKRYDRDLLRKNLIETVAHVHDLPRTLLFSEFVEEDPLHCCIVLSAALMQLSREQRSSDMRLANRADEMACEVEQLACSIVRFCPTLGSRTDLIDFLKLATDLKLKNFISEPVCSRQIDFLWNGRDVEEPIEPREISPFYFCCDLCQNEDPEAGYFRTSPLFTAFLQLLCFPFRIAFNLFCKSITEFTAFSPFVRFMMNRISYFCFLICVLTLPLQASAGDPVSNLPLEIFLAYWLFDLCFSEAAEFVDILKHYMKKPEEQGTYYSKCDACLGGCMDLYDFIVDTLTPSISKYVEDPWNIYDVIALGTAVAAAFVRGLVHGGHAGISAAASNQLYAWALALLWGRLVNVVSISSFIGPLLIMVLVMIFKDLTKFVILVVLIELPFVAALYYLESGNEPFATFSDSAQSFFQIVIGQGPEIRSLSGSSFVLLSVGTVLLSVLLLNLLIAMFSKTFDTIIENSTQEFLLQKAQLTFSWMHAPMLPPPVAFLMAIKKWAIKVLGRRFGDRCGTQESAEQRSEKKNLSLKRLFKNVDPHSQSWREMVLRDFQENAEMNSEAQMEKFKSRMLRGLEMSSESSNKLYQMQQRMATKEQIADIAKAVCATQEQIKDVHHLRSTDNLTAIEERTLKAVSECAKSTQDQMKILSDTIQSQNNQIMQLHDSMQLLLQKLQ